MSKETPGQHTRRPLQRSSALSETHLSETSLQRQILEEAGG